MSTLSFTSLSATQPRFGARRTRDWRQEVARLGFLGYHWDYWWKQLNRKTRVFALLSLLLTLQCRISTPRAVALVSREALRRGFCVVISTDGRGCVFQVVVVGNAALRSSNRMEACAICSTQLVALCPVRSCGASFCTLLLLHIQLLQCYQTTSSKPYRPSKHQGKKSRNVCCTKRYFLFFGLNPLGNSWVQRLLVPRNDKNRRRNFLLHFSWNLTGD